MDYKIIQNPGHFDVHFDPYVDKKSIVIK